MLTVDSRLWREEFAGIDRYLSQFGAHVPASLKTELKSALERVHSSQA
jgi:GTP-dependent phosphoenolpyruvate carboxykinase